MYFFYSRNFSGVLNKFLLLFIEITITGLRKLYVQIKGVWFIKSKKAFDFWLIYISNVEACKSTYNKEKNLFRPFESCQIEASFYFEFIWKPSFQ